MRAEDEYRTVEVRSIDEPPPYTSNYEKDHEVFQDEKSKDTFAARLVRSLTQNTAAQRVQPMITSSAQWTSQCWQKEAWPAIKRFRFSKRQIYAFLLVALIGIVPFAGYGYSTNRGHGFYHSAFAAKTIACGDDFGEPQNSTVSGIEALFVLDARGGTFTFAQAKSIDVAWDIIIGRGAQLCAWIITYLVFSDALLRLIERHPASFETFMRISLDGPSLGAAWTLLKELFKRRSKRTWALFFYMLLSTLYVLSIPPFLGAMTGYDSRTVAWVSIGNDTDNIVPASFFENGVMVSGTWNSTFSEPTCEASDQLLNFEEHEYERNEYCHCQAPNGTVMPYIEWRYFITSSLWSYPSRGPFSNYSIDDCHFNYTGNTQRYKTYEGQTQNCNGTDMIKIGNQSYPLYDLNYTSAYCWDGRGYDRSSIADTTRCLPDTAHQTYTWGFSSMLLGVFLIIHLIWGLTMYVVWQDAQFNSRLVKSGFRITQLRAAFVLTEAAKRRTGLEEEELIRKDPVEVNKELFGTKKRRGAEVEREVFWDEGWEIRKRRGILEEREV